MPTTATDPATDPRRQSRHADKLRDLAIVATRQHGEALRAGGYTTGLADDVHPTDPAEFSNEDLATFYTLGASLIVSSLTTQTSLSAIENKFVSRILDYAGVQP